MRDNSLDLNPSDNSADRLTISSVYSMINEVRTHRRNGAEDRAVQTMLLLVEHVLFDVELRETKHNGIKNEAAEIAYQVRMLISDTIYTTRKGGK